MEVDKGWAANLQLAFHPQTDHLAAVQGKNVCKWLTQSVLAGPFRQRTMDKSVNSTRVQPECYIECFPSGQGARERIVAIWE